MGWLGALRVACRWVRKSRCCVLAGGWIVGGEVRGHGVVEEQVALRHVLAEVTLHHAGVDEVFEERRRAGAGFRSALANWMRGTSRSNRLASAAEGFLMGIFSKNAFFAR